MNDTTNYIIRAFIVLMVALVGGIVTSKNINSWYFTDAVQRSIHTPPKQWFGIIWTVLYAMYIYTWCQSYKNSGTTYDALFGISILLNLLWIIVFFGMHNIELSKYVIIALLCTVLFQAYVMWFRQNNGVCTFMMLIYASWILCAAGLNFETKVIAS